MSSDVIKTMMMCALKVKQRNVYLLFSNNSKNETQPKTKPCRTFLHSIKTQPIYEHESDGLKNTHKNRIKMISLKKSFIVYITFLRGEK